MRSLLGYFVQLAATTVAERLEDERRYAGKHKLMFWSLTHRPQDFVDGAGIARVPPGDVLTAIAVLRSGEVFESWMGWADCRICGAHLGTKDMTAFDFVWPERAEHYIEAHGVWAPGMAELVHATKTKTRRGAS